MGKIVPYIMENKKCLKPPTSHCILKAKRDAFSDCPSADFQGFQLALHTPLDPAAVLRAT